MKSAPTSSTRSARPLSIWAAPSDRPDRNAVQAAPTSNAPALSAPKLVGHQRRGVRGHLVLASASRRSPGRGRPASMPARLSARGAGARRRSPTAARRARAIAALADAGARHDPLLADAEPLGELGVRQAALGQLGRDRQTPPAGRARLWPTNSPAGRTVGRRAVGRQRTQPRSSTSLSVRLASPVSTRPGPTSTNRSAPSSCSASSVSRQRTGLGQRLGEPRARRRRTAPRSRPRAPARAAPRSRRWSSAFSNSGTAAAIIGE